MPKFCRESMDMSLGPRPGKTAQKPPDDNLMIVLDKNDVQSFKFYINA